MKRTDFVFLNVPSLLGHQTASRSTAIYTATEIRFLMDSGLIKPNSSAWRTPYEQTVIRLSDLTEEGQDFIMSAATSKWLEACDRKSNDMLKKGATEEQRLAVYADPKGLDSRLEKFRKTRRAKSN